MIGGPIGASNPDRPEERSSKAVPPMLRHPLYMELNRACDYLKDGSGDDLAQVKSLPDLLSNFSDDYGVNLRAKFSGEMSGGELSTLYQGNLRRNNAEVAIRVIEDLAVIFDAKASSIDRPYVDIRSPVIRPVVNSVVSSLMDLDEIVRKSNEAGSEDSALSELQKNTILAQAKSITKLLEGPVAQRRTLTEFGEMLDEVLKDGGKKALTDSVHDAMIATRDKIFGLVEALSSTDLTSWSSLKEIFLG